MATDEGLYRRTCIRSECYRNENKIRSEIEANRQIISQLERNVRENSWEPHTAAIHLKNIINTNATLVDSSDGANNYAEYCVHPDAEFKNSSQKWKSTISADSSIFKAVLAKQKSLPKPDDSFDVLLVKALRRKPEERPTQKPSFASLSRSSFSSFDKAPANLERTSSSSLQDSPEFDLNIEDDFSVAEPEPKSSFTSARSVLSSNKRPPTPTTNSFMEKMAGGGARILNAAGGYNRAPKPVYPQSNRRESPSFGASFHNSAKYSANGGSSNPGGGGGGGSGKPVSAFKTAHEKLIIDQQNKKRGNQAEITQSSYGGVRKCLGTRPGPASGFKPPVKQEDPMPAALGGPQPQGENPEEIDERYKNIDPKMIELILNEIMDNGSPVHWDDIAGLHFQKATVKEIVVLPMLRPDIFTGLRGPPKGLLLFGPPGTGKTLIGKCIASQSKSTFFSISASSLTSKWVGEGEKMVRALFAVAKVHQPSVIFIDEIDSLLSARSETEHESSRRMKTEFLVQLDGAGTEGDERILIVGATNRPQELDEAARRRLVKRLLIPLPGQEARRQIINRLIGKEKNSLSEEDVEEVSLKTEGYSGADMSNLCREAAMGPIRSIDFSEIESLQADQVRPISIEDLLAGLRQVKASVSDQDLELYEDWNNKYGAGK